MLELAASRRASCYPDANAELAVRGTLFSSMMQSGQACVATTRMLVPAARYDEFCEVLALRAGEFAARSGRRSVDRTSGR